MQEFLKAKKNGSYSLKIASVQNSNKFNTALTKFYNRRLDF